MADEAAENIESLEKQLSDAEKLLDEKVTPSTATEVITEVTPPVVETTTEEAKPDETPPVKTGEEEDPLHGEKSRFGRKIKRLEDKLESTLADLKASLDFIKERTITPQAQTIEEEDTDLPEGATSEEIKEFVTKREARLLRTLEQRESDKERSAREKKQNYSKEYVKTLESMVDPDEDEEVYKLLTDTKDLTYNQVYKGNAVEDFLINYRAATKAVMNKSQPVTRTTVANKPSQIPAGVNVPGGTKPAAKVVDMSKYSKDEQDLAKAFSADELAELGF